MKKCLANEKKKQPKVIALQPAKKTSNRSMLQIAASVAILFTGYLLGGYQESQNSQQEIAVYQNEQKAIKREYDAGND